jgi:hypothetical protein
LVHKLGCKGLWTTKEPLDITTSHASGKKVVGAMFNLRHRDSLMAAAEQKGKRTLAEGTPDHFEKLLEGPCLNHSYPIKHLYKDCSLMKWFLSEAPRRGTRTSSTRQRTMLRRRRMPF